MAIRLKFLHKLLILTVTPVLIAQVGTMLAVLQTSKQDIEAGAKHALKVGAAVAEQLVQTRNRQISENVNLLASDFALKEVIAISDPESTRSALDNHAKRIGADVSAFVYADESEAHDTTSSDLERVIHRRVLSVLDKDGSVPGVFITVFNAAVYQVYTAEMKAPTTIGYLLLGFKVGENIAQPIRELTDLNVAILNIEEGAVSTTFKIFDAQFNLIDASYLLNRDQAFETVYPAMVGYEEFWVKHLPLAGGDERVFIVLASQKLKPIQHFLKARDDVLVFGLGLLIIVVAFGAWLSNSVSRPLRTLANATNSLAEGKYDSELRVSSEDEIGELASDFEEMRKAVASRESQISYQLLHDQLTGLPNQKHIIATLNSGITDNSVSTIAMIVIKLRNMDHIGSCLGLDATEKLILETAKVIQSVVGEPHCVARIDSNRFGIACFNSNEKNAASTAMNIMNNLDVGTTLGSTRITLKSHAGISHYPSQTKSAEELIRYSMIASLDAAENMQRVNHYDPGREADFTRYLQIVQDLPRAVEREELKVYFQPKIAIDSGELYGAEALVRWIHPELGFLPPDDFIAAAEQSDNIKLLTRFVLRKAIQAARNWQDEGYNLRVAINLSALDLLDRNLFSFVSTVLEENGLSHDRLILEITESSVMEELDLAVSTLSTFRDSGILTSIDDFGTGHSSLAQLRDLPLDELKIDKSFVSQIATDNTSELLVSTTIKLAHSMGLKVVAEGVEDEFSLRRLHHYNCEIVQGYYFSKPLPEHDFKQWISRYHSEEYSERRSISRPLSHNSIPDRKDNVSNPKSRKLS